MPAPKKKPKKRHKGAGKHKKPKPKPKINNKHKPKKHAPKNKDHTEEKKEMKMDESLQIRGVTMVPLHVYKESKQTFPPSIPVADLYQEKEYAVNQTMPHPGIAKYRSESSEKRALENELLFVRRLRAIHEASEVHRQVRQAAQHFIKPNLTMVEICQFIERCSLQLLGHKSSSPYQRMSFPTGCSLNNCAAHYTPNTGDKKRLKVSDLCKIDFGVEINGNIINCAFSLSFSHKHDVLMEAVRAATNRGIEVMGIGARMGEIGGEIQEVMESFECKYDNKICPVKCIANLSGHSIGKWVTDGGKAVPLIKSNDQTKMEENELYALGTFGTTGKGFVQRGGECSHFAMIANKVYEHSIDHKGTKDLFKFINKRFATMPFCRRWLDSNGHKRHLLSLKKLVDNEIVRAYPPLWDVEGSFIAQYEHTVLLKPTCKEIVSRGNDF